MTDLLTFLLNFAAIADSLVNFITAVAALFGVIMVANALMSVFVMTNQDEGRWLGQNTPTIKGIVWSFVIGGILVSPVIAVQIMGNTLLNGQAVNGSNFLYQGAGLNPAQAAGLKAIYTLFSVVGYYFFIKGWVQLNSHFNGVSRDGPWPPFWTIVGGTGMVYIDGILEVFRWLTGFDFVQIVFF